MGMRQTTRQIDGWIAALLNVGQGHNKVAFHMIQQLNIFTTYQ